MFQLLFLQLPVSLPHPVPYSLECGWKRPPNLCRHQYARQNNFTIPNKFFEKCGKFQLLLEIKIALTKKLRAD